MTGQIRDIFKEVLPPAELQQLTDLVTDETVRNNCKIMDVVAEQDRVIRNDMQHKMENLEGHIITNASDFINAKMEQIRDEFAAKLENMAYIISKQDEYIKLLESKIQNEGSSNR